MHQIDETGSAARQRNSGGLFSGRRTEECAARREA